MIRTTNYRQQHTILNFADLTWPRIIYKVKLPPKMRKSTAITVLQPVPRALHQQLRTLPPPRHTPLIKVGRCIWWIQNFKHLSTPPVSRLRLIKMIEGRENVWSPNQFTFKIQFCTCKTLILELCAFPGPARMEINPHQLLKEILLMIFFPPNSPLSFTRK